MTLEFWAGSMPRVLSDQDVTCPVWTMDGDRPNG